MNLALVSKEEAIKGPIMPVDFPLPDGLIEEMERIMRENNGIGLAAPQVGFYQALFIFDMGKGGDGLTVVCNPRLSVLSYKKYVWTAEGCLSLPNQLFNLPRWESVRLEGQDQDGKHFSWNLRGQIATVVQHETEHILGKLIDGSTRDGYGQAG